jgi:hypothetical protein
MMRLMRRRLTVLVALLALAVCAPAALAQEGGGGGAFGPLPPSAPAETPTPTPDPSIEAQQDTDRTLLYIIGGGLLVLFIVIGRVITRDAQKALRQEGRAAPPKLRDEGPHRHAKQAKAKARAKTKAQRAARRQNR